MARVMAATATATAAVAVAAEQAVVRGVVVEAAKQVDAWAKMVEQTVKEAVAKARAVEGVQVAAMATRSRAASELVFPSRRSHANSNTACAAWHEVRSLELTACC